MSISSACAAGSIRMTSRRSRERFLEARVAIHRRLQEPDVAHLVEQFDPARYNRNMTVAENLLFGTRARRGVRFREPCATTRCWRR